MKVASAKLAIALASIVLPVPAGPYSNRPFGGSQMFLKYSFIFKGASTFIFKAFLASSNPAISSKLIFSFLLIKYYSIESIKSVSGPSP